MKLLRVCVFVLFTLFPVMSASARPVTIPFVNYGNIRNWRAVDDRAILIASSHNRWYQATFFGRCQGLDSSIAVGFVTHPSGTLDKYSSILVDGQRCWFKRLDEISPPAGKVG